MLPARARPDPRNADLPWGASAPEWAAALRAILAAAVGPVQRMGPFHARETKRRPPPPRWRGGKLPAPVPLLHKRLFRLPRSMPAFSLPSEDMLRALAARPLLEVGAGSGAVSFLVAAAGGDVVATDPRPWPMGWTYDHRDTVSDLPFSQRQKRSRGYAATFEDGLRRPYAGSLDRPSPRYALSRCGPPRMRFKRLERAPRPPPGASTFHPVSRMDAAAAIAAHPGRDVLVLHPDPRHDGWVADVLAGIAPGRRLFIAEDTEAARRVPAGFVRVRGFREHPFTIREDGGRARRQAGSRVEGCQELLKAAAVEGG